MISFTNIGIKPLKSDLRLCHFISHNIIPPTSQEMTIEPEWGYIYLCRT